MAEQAGTEGERVLCQLLERSPFLPLALILLVMCVVMHTLFFFFFFQAEDGIRDLYVTGVQTCALPICPRPVFFVARTVSRGNVLASTRVSTKALCEALDWFPEEESGCASPESTLLRDRKSVV